MDVLFGIAYTIVWIVVVAAGGILGGKIAEWTTKK